MKYMKLGILKERKIEIITIAVLSILYFLNINHRNQQGIYEYTYIPLANSILENFSYKLHSDTFDTYPMWGYPALLALIKLSGFDYSFVFVFQYFLLILSLVLFFKEFNPKAHNVLFNVLVFLMLVFYTAVMSVKWPDAIVAFMIFLTAYFHIKRRYLLASLMLAIAYNFRTEAIIFLLVYSFTVLIQFKAKRQFLSFLLILPWILTTYYFYKDFIPTTTNAGGVLYISLGQLPNNPWHREHKDEYAFNFIKEKTNGQILYPWSYEANKYLTAQFIDDVKNYPIAFTKKLIFNFISVFKGGFYPFEYSLLLLVDEEKVEKITKVYKANMKLFLHDLIKFKKEAIAKFLDWSINLLSRFVLLIALYFIVKNYRKEYMALYLLFLSQIMVCVFIQYEPRHMSKMLGIMLFIVGYVQQNRQRDSSLLKNLGIHTTFFLNSINFPKLFIHTRGGPNDSGTYQER